MDREISLIEAAKEDLSAIHAIEQGNDTQEFIFGYSLEEHQKTFATPGVRYLNVCVGEQLVGFFILAVEPETRSVEFRRIVISESARGIGQLAISMMEGYCHQVLGSRRIWLDVLAKNLRAKHIYEKLGYQRLGDSVPDDPELLFYEKYLTA